MYIIYYAYISTYWNLKWELCVWIFLKIKKLMWQTEIQIVSEFGMEVLKYKTALQQNWGQLGIWIIAVAPLPLSSPSQKQIYIIYNFITACPLALRHSSWVLCPILPPLPSLSVSSFPFHLFQILFPFVNVLRGSVFYYLTNMWEQCGRGGGRRNETFTGVFNVESELIPVSQLPGIGTNACVPTYRKRN